MTLLIYLTKLDSFSLFYNFDTVDNSKTLNNYEIEYLTTLDYLKFVEILMTLWDLKCSGMSKVMDLKIFWDLKPQVSQSFQEISNFSCSKFFKRAMGSVDNDNVDNVDNVDLV